MFKTMGKLRSNKRGLTLAELIVVIALLALVFPLVFSLLSSMMKNYRIAEDRFIIQSEVQYVMNLFQLSSNKESITSAYHMDLFYDETFDSLTPGSETFNEGSMQLMEQDADGNWKYIRTVIPAAPCISDLGTITLDVDDSGDYEVLRAIEFANSDPKYTYLFGVGGYLYVLNSGTTRAERAKNADDNYNQLQTPITLSFEVATSVNELESSGGKWVEKATDAKQYYTNGVHVVVSGDFGRITDKDKNPIKNHLLSNKFKYSLDASFALRNFNKDNATINEKDDGTFEITNEYVAGYSSKSVNSVSNANASLTDAQIEEMAAAAAHEAELAGEDYSDVYRTTKLSLELGRAAAIHEVEMQTADEAASRYTMVQDTNAAGEPLYDGDGNAVMRKDYWHTHPANVMRYMSETAFYTYAGSVDVGVAQNNLLYKCAARGAMDGSRFAEPVIDTLHNFRDNVLKGTAFGDWFIDKYYNVISPELAALEAKSPLVRYTVRAFLIPTAKVLSLIS
jgi:prepilin-type N-terminal cleavage/methylation domain-containing protein